MISTMSSLVRERWLRGYRVPTSFVQFVTPDISQIIMLGIKKLSFRLIFWRYRCWRVAGATVCGRYPTGRQTRHELKGRAPVLP